MKRKTGGRSQFRLIPRPANPTLAYRSLRRSACLLFALFVGLLPASAAAAQDREIVLATTTSVRDAGLLDALLPAFEQRFGYRVKVIAVGSGQALALGRRGEGDLLLVHDPSGELAFLEEGYGIARLPLMHNEFVIVGPPGDPAGIRGMGAAEAFAALAVYSAPFVSRADRSGTHVKEQTLWQAAGVRPDGRWLRESGQGMSATLQIANELNAHTLTDISTFLTHRSPLELEILVQGDSALFNPYHLIILNPDRLPGTNQRGALELVAYLTSPATQSAIGEFGSAEFGRGLFEGAGSRELVPLPTP